MSILVVHLVPEGLLFAADRNITTTATGGGMTMIGQSQRPKVLKWPNRDVIIGYVGAGMIGGKATDERLYAFVGRNLTFHDFASLADALTGDLNAALAAGDLTDALILHLGGFEDVASEWTPRIWFIRNTTDLTASGGYVQGHQFDRSEEIAQGRILVPSTRRTSSTSVEVPTSLQRHGRRCLTLLRSRVSAVSSS